MNEQVREARSLLQLERSYEATLNDDSDLASFEGLAADTRSRLFQDASEVDASLIELLAPLKANDWQTIVAGIETDEQRSAHLTFQIYRLELSRESSESTMSEGDLPALVALLDSLRSFRAPLNLERFHVVSNEGSVKAFLTIAAALDN